MKYENLPWLILFLPLLSVVVITLFTLQSKTVSSLISIGAGVAGFVITLLFINANGFQFSGELPCNWLSIGQAPGGLQIDFGLKLDALSMMMLLVVTGVGGVNRARIINVLEKRPYNAHKLAEKLELDYKTV